MVSSSESVKRRGAKFKETFSIVQDTPDAIVAVATDVKKDKRRSISARVIVIDKSTGDFRSVSFSTKDNDDSVPLRGTCAH